MKDAIQAHIHGLFNGVAHCIDCSRHFALALSARYDVQCFSLLAFSNIFDLLNMI